MARTLEALKTLLVSEEEAARHLFVVCGIPADLDGFHSAWLKEDPEWFVEWCELKYFIKELETQE